MFFGTTPQIISQYLHKEIKTHNPERIFIPFAGNFVVEQISHIACPGAEVHSTDVSIYSRAIGFGVNNIPFHLELKEAIREEFEFLANKKEPIEKAAIVIFFTEVSGIMSKKDIPYYRNLYNDAVNNQEKYFDKILNQLNSFKENSKFTFYGIDACKVIEDIKEGDLVFYDPPVILGDYEKMFSALKECLEFDEVGYTEINDELKAEQLQSLCKKGAVVYYRTNNPIKSPENYSEVFRYRYKWNGQYCIYTNKPNEIFTGSFSPLKEEPKNIKIIGSDDDITVKSKVNIIQVQSKLANHYRLMWVKKAQMTDSGYAFLIFIDGKLIGLLQLDSALKFGSDLIVINSDPAAPTSKYKRLSRLVIQLCSTEEMIKTINDLSMWEHSGFTTRVFTNNPTSMKYRGVFELKERSEDKGSDYNFKLIYHNRKRIFPRYKDALINWVQKYGKETI